MPTGRTAVSDYPLGALEQSEALSGCRNVPPTLCMPGCGRGSVKGSHLHHLSASGGCVSWACFWVRFRVCSLGLVGLRACPGDAGGAGGAGDAGALFGRRKFQSLEKHAKMHGFRCTTPRKTMLFARQLAQACVRACTCVRACMCARMGACVRHLPRSRPPKSIGKRRSASKFEAPSRNATKSMNVPRVFMIFATTHP